MKRAEPLYDRLIVEVVPEPEEDGVLDPDTAKEKPSRGIVREVGEGTDAAKPMKVKVGDEILFEKFSGTEVRIFGKPVTILREEDVLVIIHHDEED